MTCSTRRPVVWASTSELEARLRTAAAQVEVLSVECQDFVEYQREINRAL